CALPICQQQKRNFLATLFLSQGVPMLLAGDEMGRTQHGNNNAYCQDNELSWLSWEPTADDQRLLDFVRRLIALRQEHPVFSRRNFFHGRDIRGGLAKDIFWMTPDGEEMTDDEWNTAFARCLGVYFAGDALDERDRRGRPLVDDNCLLLVYASHEAIDFTLPHVHQGMEWWYALFDTADAGGLEPRGYFASSGTYPLTGRSLALLVERREKAG